MNQRGMPASFRWILSAAILGTLLAGCSRRGAEAELRFCRDVCGWVRENAVVETEIQARCLEELERGLDRIPYARLEVPKPERPAYFTGTGILCRSEGKSPGRIVVADVFGDVASKVPCWRGDEILEIEGKPAAGFTVPEIHRKMYVEGKVGSTLRLKIHRVRQDITREFEIPRRRIRRPTAYNTCFLDADRKIGYVYVDRFIVNTPEDLRQQVDRLAGEGLRALVLDLRWNEGGVLESAIDCAAIFLERTCTLVQEARNPVYRKAHAVGLKVPPYPRFPLAVLVNEETASAAEVLAGLLQEEGRARLVGSATFGKGAVLAEKRFLLEENPYRVRIPVALCRLPSGRFIDRRIHWHGAVGRGLEPDVKVVLSGDERFCIQELRFLEEARKGRRFEPPVPLDAQVTAAMDVLSK